VSEQFRMERRVFGQREKSQRLPPSYRWLERMEVCEGGSQKFVEKLREIVHAARGRFSQGQTRRKLQTGI